MKELRSIKEESDLSSESDHLNEIEDSKTTELKSIEGEEIRNDEGE